MRWSAKAAFPNRWRKQKVDFKSIYVQAMRERAPELFKELRKAGRKSEFLQKQSEAAHQMRDELLEGKPKNPEGRPMMADERWAEEIVLAHFLDFPVPEKDQNPEPPDDLPHAPTRAFEEPISRSNQET